MEILIIVDVGLGRSRTSVDTEPLPRLAERATDDGKFGGGSGKPLA